MSTVTLESVDIDNPDLPKEEGEGETYHPILEVWRAILTPAIQEATSKITPQWASRITQSYREIAFADMKSFQEVYFSNVIGMLNILSNEIDSDEECLKVLTPEEDASYNAGHYVNVLTEWQKQMVLWEDSWDCQDPLAGVHLGALSEVHRMFFAEEGLTALLDQIPFVFKDEQREALAQELIDFRESLRQDNE